MSPEDELEFGPLYERGPVYCCDCRYNRLSAHCGSDCCVPVGANYYARKNWKRQDPSVRNEHNDCEDYKRKWWKFWIGDEVEVVMKRVSKEKIWGPDYYACDACGERILCGEIRKIGFDRFWDRVKYGKLVVCQECYDKY